MQLNYGQRRPFERGRPIELADGQTLENVNFNLPRGSVIAGRIVDEFGEPVADAMVSALHYRTFSGRRRLVPVGRFGTTDDMGHFRLYGLAPGDYYISATLRPMGGMGFEVGPSDITTGYAPTYYPGTASSQQADRVSVGLGAEMSGITFSLLPVRTVKVSGTAVDSSGKPMAGAFVMLSADMRSGEGGFMMFGGGGNQIKDDGSFVISNVTPGDYVLRADADGAGARRGDDGVRVGNGQRLGRRGGRHRRHADRHEGHKPPGPGRRPARLGGHRHQAVGGLRQCHGQGPGRADDVHGRR